MRGRLHNRQRDRMNGLLDMEYSPAELAEVIGISRRQIYRVYRHMGCPVRVDERGHLWINGKKFLLWYDNVFKKNHMAPDDTYCRTCGQPVKIVNPQIIEKNRVRYVQSECPKCRRILSRIITSQRRTR